MSGSRVAVGARLGGGIAPASRAQAGARGRRHFARGQSFGGFGYGQAAGHGAPPRVDNEKLYSTLGVDRHASDEAIKKAYKKQAMKHHPDRGGDEATFKEISRAYEILSNPEQRQLYDAYGEQGLNMEQGAGVAGAGVHNPYDIFSQIFGFNVGNKPRGKPRTPDSRYELMLSLEEIYSGTSRKITFNRDALCRACEGYGGRKPTKCQTCDGTGRIVTMQHTGVFVQSFESPCPSCGSKGYTIPPGNICGSCNGRGTTKERKTFDVNIEPGVQDGTEFRFRAQADEAPGHDTGDVVISIVEKPHPTFARVKDSLVMSKKVSLSEALCGFELSTTFLDGEELVLRSSPGQVVKPKQVMVVQGKGMPRPNGALGQLFVVMDVDFPETLSPDMQRQLGQILDAPPLSDPPPMNAATPIQLSKSQTQAYEKQWRQAAHDRGSRESANNGFCAQQ
eukprot:CAMPEP_0170223708 /NCGR_PEP_ID=MMETSP0116_2-20130129/11554_1 /TAXON_ID=400756 /ORGANISM="Durinskia baltica, Strain CSIRO CS-38" /LENGTH=449 /DNA_ID=CAMNT_0010474411 /DNA_START=44 /DNA_END=1394 /DNA_ORIENTATION=+